MNQLQRLISIAGLLISLALPAKSYAGGSVELMAGNKNSTLDLKVGAEIAPKLQLFSRQISSLDYEWNVGHFGFASLGYNPWDGLSVLVQAQAIPGVGAAPRIGVEYFKQLGDFGLYGGVAGIVSDLQNNPKMEIELSAIVDYQPSLNENLQLATSVEAVTLLSPERGHDFSLQRLRLGLKTGKFEFGPALNLEETSDAVSYNVGGAVKVNF